MELLDTLREDQLNNCLSLIIKLALETKNTVFINRIAYDENKENVTIYFEIDYCRKEFSVTYPVREIVEIIEMNKDDKEFLKD